MKGKQIIYRLVGDIKPASFLLATRHTKRKKLLHFVPNKDGKGGESRAIRYASNHRSIYVDEQQGEAITPAVEFSTGTLMTDEYDTILNEFLAAHPDNVANGGNIFYKMDKAKEARDAAKLLDIEFEAQALARSLSLTEMKDIYRIYKPGRVDKVDAEEIKHDIKFLAKNDPVWFMEVAESSETQANGDIDRIIDAKLISVRKTGIFWTLEDRKDRMIAIPHDRTPRQALDDYFAEDKQGQKDFKFLYSLLEK